MGHLQHPLQVAPSTPHGCWLSLPFSQCECASCALPSGVLVPPCPFLLVLAGTGCLRAPTAAPGSTPTMCLWQGAQELLRWCFQPHPTMLLSQAAQGKRPDKEAWMKQRSGGDTQIYATSCGSVAMGIDMVITKPHGW